MSTEKDLNYWKANAEEDYKQVPISVLRYITELETAVKNCSIPDVSKRFWHFDCWDRHGNLQTITIEALNEENATIIFKAKHENLGFDPPY